MCSSLQLQVLARVQYCLRESRTKAAPSGSSASDLEILQISTLVYVLDWLEYLLLHS